MNVPWQITLFGTLRVQRGEHTISRFATAKTAALLARLAYFSPRDHPREELIDLLWPDTDLERGRRSLRVALASLRRQLEPPGTPFAEVLRAGHDKIGLTAGSVMTDVSAWEAALRGAAQANSLDAQAALLSQAADLYTGPLLPGFYDDWILAERDRLAQRHLDCLRRLSAVWRELGDWERAIDGAQRALAAEPSHEEVHADLIRLYAAAGQPESAQRQYKSLERVLRDEWQESPSASLRDLVSGLQPSPPAAASAAIVRVPPSVQDTAPPEGAATDPRIRLPFPLTRFFGRELEIATLMQMLTDPATRLVTLLGPGGAGKTRLALETAKHLAATNCFPGPVCFVPLADLADPTRLLAAVAEALRLTLKGEGRPAEQIAAALGAAPALLVLDNLEHLGEAGAAQVRVLLDGAPSLTCLVTSRCRLDLEGERELPLLPLPTPGLPGLPARLIEFPSVQLFVDRAQAVRPDFQVTRGNADAVAAVCCDLEGLPLALELAAARIQALTPGQMQVQLRARLDFLISRRRDLPPRHRSLRATLEWSAHLLSPEEMHCFRQLSVFRGGWTLEAAQAVCGTSGILDLLERLREQSLIVAEERAEGMRFRMLESVRAFAAEALTPDEASALARRQASCFLDFAEAAAPGLTTPDQAAWLERLEADHDNLRRALSYWLSAEASVDEALRLAGALWRFWAVRGHYQEGRGWLHQALARPGGSPEARAKAANGAGNLAWGQSDYASAKTLLTEALELNRALGHAVGIAAVLGNLGMVATHQGDFALARTLHGQCLALRRQQGDRRGTAFALDCLAVTCLHQKCYAEARVFMQESLALWEELGQDTGRMMSLCNLGIVLMEEGAYADAARHFTDSLPLARALQDQNALTALLEGFAVLAARQQQFVRCVPLLAAMAALRRRLGTPYPPNEVALNQETLAAARAALGESQYSSLWAEGQAMTTAEAIAYALDSPTL